MDCLGKAKEGVFQCKLFLQKGYFRKKVFSSRCYLTSGLVFRRRMFSKSDSFLNRHNIRTGAAFDAKQLPKKSCFWAVPVFKWRHFSNKCFFFWTGTVSECLLLNKGPQSMLQFVRMYWGVLRSNWWKLKYLWKCRSKPCKSA